MKKAFSAFCLALVLAACGGGGGSDSVGGSAGSASADALKAKPAVVDPTLAAQPVSVVNADAGDQVVRAVGAQADGGYTVAWASGGTFYIQRYDSAGNKVGAPVPIVETDVDRKIAVLANGDVVVTDFTRDAALNEAITVSRYDASGAFLGQRELVSNIYDPTALWPQSNLGSQNIKVIPLADGGFVVGWTLVWSFPRVFGPQTKVFTQRYDSQGIPVGVPVQLMGGLSEGTFTAIPVYTLTPDALGGYSAWVSIGGGFTELLIHFDAAGTATEISRDVNVESLLLPLEGDRYVLFTFNAPQHLASRQFLDSTGAPVGAPETIAAMPFAARELVDGSFVVFWSSGSAVTAQRYDSAGVAIGNLLTLGSGAAVPVTTPLANGGFAAAWSALGTGGDLDAFTQRFTETLTTEQALLRAKRKACQASAIGMAGQDRKVFMESCLRS